MEKALKKIEKLQAILDGEDFDNIKVDFIIESKDEIKKIANQENEHFFKPSEITPYYWTIVIFGKVEATFRTKELKLKLIYDV